MRTYKLLIVDFDGTICDTQSAIIYCMEEAFKFHELSVPSHQRIISTIMNGLGLEDSYKFLTTNTFLTTDSSKVKTEVDIIKWIETYRKIYAEHASKRIKPFENATVVFEKLHLEGLFIVIVSNKGVNAIKDSVEQFGLDQYISLIVGDTAGIIKKPNPMPYEHIIKPIFENIQPNEILVIGDTKADLEFAKNIGADSCWASYGYGIQDECKAMNPTHIITCLDDLIKILLKNEQTEVG